ncbi:MAG: DUF3455 domain-containing protein [Candidatus Binatia bacterium]
MPAGNKLFLEGHASGTQDYICLPSGAGFAWTFFGPQATLFDDNNEQIITHFLSPNFSPISPEISGALRATWQDSQDTSAVWGNKIASADHTSDPTIVAADAIPWLLLQAVGAQCGPTGGHTLTATTFIQRLSTTGGVAPSSGCAVSTDVGSKMLVPYSANYLFYEAETPPTADVLCNLGNPGIASPELQFQGLTYSEWSAKWFQWTYSLPFTQHQLFDTADCSAGQTGDVWFIDGTRSAAGFPPGGRDCAIPGGTALFLALRAAYVDNEGCDSTGTSIQRTDFGEPYFRNLVSGILTSILGTGGGRYRWCGSSGLVDIGSRDRATHHRSEYALSDAVTCVRLHHSGA